MTTAAPPPRERLTAFALRILEDALARAEHAPTRGTVADRLALAWLAYAGVGLPWHYEKFWTSLSADHRRKTENYSHYIRTTELTGLLHYWYLQMGWEEPCGVQRREWARAYALARPSAPDPTAPL